MKASLHIAQHVADIFELALHHGLRADDLTTPAAVAEWGEWIPTHQWMAEHGRKETNDA